MTTAIAVDPPQGPSDISAFSACKNTFAHNRSAPLGSALVAGRFSLADRDPVTITAVPGLVVHVHSGLLWVTEAADNRRHRVRTGERFIAYDEGLLTVSTRERTELQLVWP
jgi:hypothetical protein